jgi:hypothetical protein
LTAEQEAISLREALLARELVMVCRRHVRFAKSSASLAPNFTYNFGNGSYCIRHETARFRCHPRYKFPKRSKYVTSFNERQEDVVLVNAKTKNREKRGVGRVGKEDKKKEE